MNKKQKYINMNKKKTMNDILRGYPTILEKKVKTSLLLLLILLLLLLLKNTKSSFAFHFFMVTLKPTGF